MVIFVANQSYKCVFDKLNSKLRGPKNLINDDFGVDCILPLDLDDGS